VALTTGRLERSERLRQSRDFQRVARHGTRVASRDFVLLVAPGSGCAGGLPARRLGVTASRKVGNAVVRNRMKRLLRVAFRLQREALPEGIDLVVIPRRLREPTLDELSASLVELSQRVAKKLRGQSS
jgi:ribonuclease P protein component